VSGRELGGKFFKLKPTLLLYIFC